MPSHRASPAALAAVVLALLAPLLGAAAASAQDRPPVTVTVETLETEDLTLTTTLPGRVVASLTAEVRPQVEGLIVERLFEEGSKVAAGDPLYRIDDASYEALVAAARAQVSQATARLRATEKEAERVQALIDRAVVSEQSLDEAVAERDAAAAALEVAEAARLSAEINLERTVIRAPISGVIGRSLVTQGALVAAGQATPLTVIRKLDPVLVDVTQSASELIEWRRGLVSGRLADAELTVTLTLADGGGYEHSGLLTAAEPYVDELTGVVTLRLQFPNPQELLLPGMYVQVQMPQGVAEDVVLAPQEGVTRDRRGRPVALVVNADGVVEQRVLTVLQAKGSDWVVRDGLAPGDRMIVEGLQKAAPGATVVPEERAPEPAAAAGSEPAAVTR